MCAVRISVCKIRVTLLLLLLYCIVVLTHSATGLFEGTCFVSMVFLVRILFFLATRLGLVFIRVSLFLVLNSSTLRTFSTTYAKEDFISKSSEF